MGEQISFNFEESEADAKLNSLKKYLADLILYESIQENVENGNLTIKAELSARQSESTAILGAFRSLSRNASFKNASKTDNSISADLAYPIGNVDKLTIIVTKNS